RRRARALHGDRRLSLHVLAGDLGGDARSLHAARRDRARARALGRGAAAQAEKARSLARALGRSRAGGALDRRTLLTVLLRPLRRDDYAAYLERVEELDAFHREALPEFFRAPEGEPARTPEYFENALDDPDVLLL